MRITIEQGDVLQFASDVLVLKYAQSLHGVDLAVVDSLGENGVHFRGDLPHSGGHLMVQTDGRLPSAAVLFVGVPRLRLFDYQAIRDFGRRALSILKTHTPNIKTIAITLHGANYGLDEAEAFRSELGGIVDAMQSGDCPPSLDVVTFVERNVRRAERLQDELASILPDGVVDVPTMSRTQSSPARDSLQSAGSQSLAKAHIFVAMPFADEFDDRFHYGIQSAVHHAGYLCERADLAIFSGDIVDWIRQRIDSAALVIADLTTANPNVYLEVGYAWGRGVRTVLLVSDLSELRFDVKSQRCLVYKSIRNLEELLTKELLTLK